MTTATDPGTLLRRALLGQRRDVLWSTALYSTHQLGEALVPVIIGATISQAIARGITSAIVLWLGVLGADFVALSLSFRFAARASMRARQGVGHQVRMWIVERVVRPDGGVVLAPGDLLTRAGSDATRVGEFARILASTVAAAVVLAASVALLLRFSVILAAVILVGTVVLLVVTGTASARFGRHSAVEQNQAGQAATTAEDLVRGLRVLRGIGAEETAASRYALVSRSALGAAIRAGSSQAAQSGLGTLLTGAYLTVVVGIGGWLAVGGSLGVGEFVAALGLAQFVIGPMNRVAAAAGSYARAVASAGRIAEILDAPPSVLGGERRSMSPTAGPVAFEAVPIHGPRPLSLTAPAGELTGLVVDAVTAAEVAALLAREHDPVGGRISIGGIGIDRWHLDTLRAGVLVSPHDAALFPGSVADNIGVRAASLAAGRRGTWAAFAEQVTEIGPDGTASDVGERGQNLSGGQRQRVALARALAAEPPVLVLHDPTTSVDAATEDRIADRLSGLRQGHTTILITSSAALLSRCDRVVIVGADGTETGSHRELLGRSRSYREAVAR